MNIQEFVHSNTEYIEIYEFYEFKDDIVQKISNNSKKRLLKVFASNQCQYCKIYIPQMLKIHEVVHFNIEFELWEDFDEDGQIDIMDEFSLTGLPTIIIYKNCGTKLIELGRIVKEPTNTIEEDLLSILEIK